MDTIDFKANENGISIFIPKGYILHLAETASEPISIANEYDFLNGVKDNLENLQSVVYSNGESPTDFLEVLTTCINECAVEGTGCDFIDGE